MEAKKEKIELVPALKEDEDAMPALDSDLESSLESDGVEAGLLDGIVDTKAKGRTIKKVIEVDAREREIEDLLFGGDQGSSLFSPDSPEDDDSSSAEDMEVDESSDEEDGAMFVIGEESEKRKKVREPNDHHSCHFCPSMMILIDWMTDDYPLVL